MSSWNNNSYPFDATSIHIYAPNQSGVYALHDSQRWIYVGETENLHDRLMQHVNGDNACVTRQRPTHFSFELWPGQQRVRRQDQLIVELGPSCNQRLG